MPGDHQHLSRSDWPQEPAPLPVACFEACEAEIPASGLDERVDLAVLEDARWSPGPQGNMGLSLYSGGDYNT